MQIGIEVATPACRHAPATALARCAAHFKIINIYRLAAHVEFSFHSVFNNETISDDINLFHSKVYMIYDRLYITIMKTS